MWIEAFISSEDLRRLLVRFAPLRIRLGNGGVLALESPSEVSLVADLGARIVCAAQVHWPFLGIHVPMTIKSLAILLRPVIEAHANGDAVVFKLEIEHADLALVPTAIDNRITALVNAELAKRHVELTWRYADTLDHVFHLPDSFDPIESLALVMTSAVVKVTNEAVGLAISVRCDVLRGDDRGVVDSKSGDVPSPPVSAVTAARQATASTAGLSSLGTRNGRIRISSTFRPGRLQP